MDYANESSSYFDFRQITPEFYGSYKIPPYLAAELPSDRSARIIDYGCGLGHLLLALRNQGYNNAIGIDIDQNALAHCKSLGLNVVDGNDLDAMGRMAKTAAVVVMSHVLEHIPKEHIITFLKKVRCLLGEKGALIIMVPNAHAFSGCYWAYEDFTHHTLFTTGSLYYVLKAAGFSSIRFIDPKCVQGLVWWKKFVRLFLLGLYRINYYFWLNASGGQLHKPSPVIFSYEIKARAEK